MALSLLREKGMKLLSVEETAQALGMSRQSIVRMIGDAGLPMFCLRSGKRKKVWKIRSEALEKWVATKERETARDIAGSRVAPTNNGNHDSNHQNGGQNAAL
jgi:excisionase family DNA binding protein